MKIDKWSYSRLKTFTQIKTNERKMEFMRKEPERSIDNHGTSSCTAGSAYHEVLALWLNAKKIGAEVSLERTTLKEKMKTKTAQRKFESFLKNFSENKKVYEEILEDSEILGVEISFTEKISVGTITPNIPCEGRIDLIVKDPEDKNSLIIIDHKTSSFESRYCNTFDTWQPYISTLLVEKGTGKKVSKVLQIENNISRKPKINTRSFMMKSEDRAYYARMIKNRLNEFLRMAEAA